MGLRLGGGRWRTWTVGDLWWLEVWKDGWLAARDDFIASGDLRCRQERAIEGNFSCPTFGV